MRLVAKVALLLSLSGCISHPKQAPYSWDVVDRLSQEQWEEHHNEQVYARFNTEWLLFNNANYIDHKGGCYALSDGVEDLILIQNESGEIQAVVPKSSTPKSECFVKVFLGQKYPAPPYAPFYHYMRMHAEP